LFHSVNGKKDSLPVVGYRISAHRKYYAILALITVVFGKARDNRNSYQADCLHMSAVANESAGQVFSREPAKFIKNSCKFHSGIAHRNEN